MNKDAKQGLAVCPQCKAATWHTHLVESLVHEETMTGHCIKCGTVAHVKAFAPMRPELRVIQGYTAGCPCRQCYLYWYANNGGDVVGLLNGSPAVYMGKDRFPL